MIMGVEHRTLATLITSLSIERDWNSDKIGKAFFNLIGAFREGEEFPFRTMVQMKVKLNDQLFSEPLFGQIKKKDLCDFADILIDSTSGRFNQDECKLIIQEPEILEKLQKRRKKIKNKQNKLHIYI